MFYFLHRIKNILTYREIVLQLVHVITIENSDTVCHWILWRMCKLSKRTIWQTFSNIIKYTDTLFNLTIAEIKNWVWKFSLILHNSCVQKHRQSTIRQWFWRQCLSMKTPRKTDFRHNHLIKVQNREQSGHYKGNIWILQY